MLQRLKVNRDPCLDKYGRPSLKREGVSRWKMFVKISNACNNFSLMTRNISDYLHCSLFTLRLSLFFSVLKLKSIIFVRVAHFLSRSANFVRAQACSTLTKQLGLEENTVYNLDLYSVIIEFLVL